MELFVVAIDHVRAKSTSLGGTAGLIHSASRMGVVMTNVARGVGAIILMAATGKLIRGADAARITMQKM